MKLKLLILLFLSAIVWCSIAVAQDENPYIYYYSEQHQSFVVERADGTDTRLIMSMPAESGSQFSGPGWSPDGEWFSWFARERWFSYPLHNAAVVNPSTGQILETINRGYNEIDGMIWSLNSQLLLVKGTFCLDCYNYVYSLASILEDQALAGVVLMPEAGSAGEVKPYEWLPDNGGVVFYELDALTPRAATRITLFADGRVLKEPLTREEWPVLYPTPAPETLEDLLSNRFISPQGRYLIEGGAITDTETGISHPLYTGSWSEREVGYLDAVEWHPSEEWAFLTFERGEGYFVTVLFKTDGTYQRELCTCHPGYNLIGWLPDNVDVDSIPLLADAP